LLFLNYSALQIGKTLAAPLKKSCQNEFVIYVFLCPERLISSVILISNGRKYPLSTASPRNVRAPTLSREFKISFTIKGETSLFPAATSSNNEKRAFYLFSFREEDGSLLKINMRLADDIYFLNYSNAAKNWPLADIFLDRGFKFDQQNATNDYRCPNLTYQTELMNFMRIEVEGKKDREMENIARENKLWGLPYLMEHVSKNLEFMLLEGKAQKKAQPLLYLLTVRLDYSIFYMPYAKSVWRSDENLKYTLDGTRDLYSSFDTYETLKKKGYGDEEIKKIDVSEKNILKEESGRI